MSPMSWLMSIRRVIFPLEGPTNTDLGFSWIALSAVGTVFTERMMVDYLRKLLWKLKDESLELPVTF